MKITDVKTFLVGTPPPHLGGNNWLFVKVETDEGLVGYGECNATFDREKTLIQMIKDFSDMYVIGSDPFKVELLWETLTSGGHHYMRHGGMITTQAASAIEMACWDIIGKALNQPVYNLLGGKYNDRIRAYTYLEGWHCSSSPETVGELFMKYVEMGFTAVKFDPVEPIYPAPRDLSLKDLQYAEDCVRSAREAVGNKCDIIIGTHGQLTTHAAIRLAERLEQYDPMWFEEPVPLENADEMARVAQHTTIPIATGERLCTKYEFVPLLEKQAAQIMQIHLGLNGILEAKKIAGMCQTHYAQIAPWMYCGPIAAAAAVQIDTCSPNFLIQEGLGTWTGFDSMIVKDYIKYENGFVTPPTAPGLGVELNEKVLAKYPPNPSGKVSNK